MMNYPNMYQPMMNFAPEPPRVMNQPINWVSGEAGAKSWIMGKGETVLLMDSESQVFYLKSTDQTGMPMPLRVFDYKERVTETPQNTVIVSNNDYVTRQEYDELKALVNSLKKESEVAKDE